MQDPLSTDAPLRLERGREGNVLTFTLTGLLTVEAFLEAVEPLRHDDEYAASLRLWDFRGVRSTLSSSEMFMIGKVVNDMHKDVPSVAAYVINEGVQRMKFETYRNARTDERHLRRGFTTIEDALAWLNEMDEARIASVARRRVERSDP